MHDLEDQRYQSNLPVYDLSWQCVVGSQMSAGEPQHGSSDWLLGSLLQQGLACSQGQSSLLHCEWICSKGRGDLSAAGAASDR